MDLLTAELKGKIPRLGSSESTQFRDRLVYTKYFDPTSNWRWYVLEFDGKDTFFGLVVTTHHALAGEFTLSELRGLRYRHDSLGEVGVERDTYFRPLTVKDLEAVEPVVAKAFGASSGLKLIELDPGV